MQDGEGDDAGRTRAPTVVVIGGSETRHLAPLTRGRYVERVVLLPDGARAEHGIGALAADVFVLMPPSSASIFAPSIIAGIRNAQPAVPVLAFLNADTAWSPRITSMMRWGLTNASSLSVRGRTMLRGLRQSRVGLAIDCRTHSPPICSHRHHRPCASSPGSRYAPHIDL
jgi:hypothetical protein